MTSAADATAWASHDFDEVEAAWVTVADFFHHLTSIGKAVANANVNWETVEVNGSFLHAFEAADHFEVDVSKRFAGIDFVSSTDSSFHNTTGSTEDDSSTC